MSSSLRKDLEAELKELQDQELAAEAELNQSFESVFGGGRLPRESGSSGMRFTSALDLSVLSNSLNKIEGFSPNYEAMAEGSRKLSLQVEDCRALSDRINVIVRRLDSMQIRSQKALACTEDIINLKESKRILQAAIDEKDLHAAVRCIQMVHHIDKLAAGASEDYKEILNMEGKVKDMVQSSFDEAINSNELNEVMSLCPLLQTLGLETTARDKFLEFVSTNVFIAVTADGEAVGNATDPASGYAHALSGVFNSAYLILQKYLPLIIQGMENSLGDIHFVGRLHAHTEKQAGLVLKRYMKYRNCKEVILSVKSAGVDGELAAVPIGVSGGGNNVAVNTVSVESAAGLHEMLDELALLIQYCCLYSKYLWQLCNGAKLRVRPAFVQSSSLSEQSDQVTPLSEGSRGHTSSTSHSIAKVSSSSSRRTRSRTMSTTGADDEHTAATLDSGGSTESRELSANAVTEIFPGPLAFDKIVDELINGYYMEAEKWIMHRELSKMIKEQRTQQRRRIEAADRSIEAASEFSSPFNDGLDEAFFVLQRCGQRAIATNNVHAACAVLHLIGDLVSSELLAHISEGMSTSTKMLSDALMTKIGTVVNLNGRNSGSGDGEEEYVLDKTLMRGYQNAVQLATSMQVGAQGDQASDYSSRIQTKLGANSFKGGAFDMEEDPFGIAEWLQVYNTAERCAKYSERLGVDVAQSGEAVFSHRGISSGGDNGADDADKIKLCQEGFSAASQAFRSALYGELDKLAKAAGKVMKEILFGVFGPSGPLGGIKFDLPDEAFETQASLAVAPAALTRAIEMIIDMTIMVLTEANRDILLGLLAEQFCDRLEGYITTQTFQFCGALKMEECVRAVITCFNQKAGPGLSLRAKFGRLKEVMMVLTSDVISGATFADSLAQLTYKEAEVFLGLRTAAVQ